MPHVKLIKLAKCGVSALLSLCRFYLEILQCVGTMNPVLFRDDDQELRFNSHQDRDHNTTLWYHRDTAEALGMHADIQEAFGYIGAESLLTMDYPSYPTLTSEFLSHFSMNITGPGDEEGKVRFRLGNQRHSLRLRVWNRIFGFRNPTQVYQQHDFRLFETWCLLTGENFLPTAALPVNKIASPLFRVIMRILGNTIWARKENSKPTKWELACVHGMLFRPDFEMNMGWEFLKHLKAYVSKQGEIWFGGMITRLAEHFDVNLDNYEYLGDGYIDRTYLLHAKVLVVSNRVVCSRIEVNGSMCTVPVSAEKMDLLHVPNWYETWTEVPRNADSPPDWNPYTNTRLRRRGRRVYGEDEEQEDYEEEEEDEGQEGNEELDGQDDVVMHEPQGLEWPAPPAGGPVWPAPTWQGPTWQDPRWQATGGASGSGGGGDQSTYNPDYSFYQNLCSKFEGWNTNFVEMRKSNEEVRKSLEEVKTSFEKRCKEEDDRREIRERRDQSLMTWAQTMGYNRPPSPGSEDPPQNYFG